AASTRLTASAQLYQYTMFLRAGEARRRVAEGSFGFSWAVAVLPRNPPDYRAGFPWISLDSLVRIVTYQWVTRDKRDKIFSRGFSALLGLHVGGKSPPCIGNGRFGHPAILSQFVISCNRLRPVRL